MPGHERFVRTMVAGATGIDLYLMVVAADDGVMPQTREHAAVLAALGVTVGVVAVTKCDLADPARAAAEAAELLPGAEIVRRVGAHRRGAGGAARRAGAGGGAGRRAARGDGPLRLHVDRVFTIRGAGTVVTGTLWSGVAERGAQVTVLPRGPAARVRGVEVHDEPVERAAAGQRVALNLGGSGARRGRAGDVIVAAGAATRAAAASRAAAGERRSSGEPDQLAPRDLPRRRRAHLGHARRAARQRRAGRRPSRHARVRRAARRARRAVLPAAPRGADRARARRPARDPRARPAGHARRRRRARSRARDATGRAATCSRGSPGSSAASPNPRRHARRPAPPPERAAAHPARRSRSSSACERAGHEPPLDEDPANARRACASTAARSGSDRRCTSTPTRSTRSTTSSSR